MIAYKFLQAGRVGPFSHFAWPEGAWVQATPNVCASGIHACEARDLPYWIDMELWEIELEDVERCEHKLVARRGRLVRRLDAWDGDARQAFADWCAERGGALAARDGRAAEYAADLVVHAGNGNAAPAGFIAVRAAEVVDGDEGYAAEREAQARWLADRLGLA